MARLIAERGRLRAGRHQGRATTSIGIVTVHDGAVAPGRARSSRRPSATIRRSPALYHNNFQDPETFLAAGGLRGRQLQALVEGTYYINRLFATVEMIPKTVIEVGNVGVVVSYTGEHRRRPLRRPSTSTASWSSTDTRGVWNEPLLPGKYAFNTYAGKVMIVPTTNFILKWNKQETGSHRYDENLSEVLAHHQGRVRAVAAALGRRAHRLPQGAARRSSASATSSGSSSRRSIRWCRRTSRTSARRARSSS